MGQRLLTDQEIQSLLSEGKPLPDNWRSRLRTRAKTDMRFTHRDLEIKGENDRTFRVILRQSTLNNLDFSIILTFVDTDGQEYRLTRFNGRHPSQHTNKVERDLGKRNHSFRNVFHVHTATERYQIAGYKIDGFAEPTAEFNSFESALELFVRRNGLHAPPADPMQNSLFP